MGAVPMASPPLGARLGVQPSTPVPPTVRTHENHEELTAVLHESTEATDVLEAQLRAALSAAAAKHSELEEEREAAVQAAQSAYALGRQSLRSEFEVASAQLQAQERRAKESTQAEARHAEQRISAAEEEAARLHRVARAQDAQLTQLQAQLMDAAGSQPSQVLQEQQGQQARADTVLSQGSVTVIDAPPDAAEQARAEVESWMHTELASLEGVIAELEQAVPVTFGLRSAVATAAAVSVPLLTSGQKRGGWIGRSADAAAAVLAEAEARRPLQEALLEVQGQLQAREAEIETLRASLRVAQQRASSQGPIRTVGGPGGFGLATALPEPELLEMESTLDRLETTLLRKGAWRTAPSDANLLTSSRNNLSRPSSPRGCAGPTKQLSPSGRTFLTELWGKISGVEKSERGLRGGFHADSSRIVVSNTDSGGLLETVDMDATRRRDELMLIDVAAESRQLLADSRANQKLVRAATNDMAKEAARAHTTARQQFRTMSLHLGAAELQRDQARRKLREVHGCALALEMYSSLG